MECPACRSPFQPGDRFCGNCGERLPETSPSPRGAMPAPSPAGPPAQAALPPLAAQQPQAAPPQPPLGGQQPPMGMPQPQAAPPMAAPPGIAAAAVEVRDPGAMPAITCPVCASMIPAGAARCPICYYERDMSAGAAAPGSRAESSPASTGITSAMICPTHGPLDPSWTRCPYCLREGRDSRISARPVDTGLPSAPIPTRNSMIAPLSPPASAPPGMTPMGAPQQPPVAAPQQPSMGQPPSAAAPQMPAAGPPPAMSQARPAPAAPADRPPSSVGATFAIRRLPRVLAYLIEKEGEAVGRVHQLEDSVTDVGRDPRNHIVLSDASISGFHARLERGPDGNFIITDHGSTNGSFLNGERLTTARVLKENDELRLGSTTLVLKIVI